MPRKKNGKGSDRSKGTPHHGDTSIYNAFVKSSSPYYGFQAPGFRNSDSDQPHFSLRDEARSTQKHSSDWKAEVKLRHSRVTFVSATGGNGEDLELLKGERESDSSIEAESNTDSPPNPVDVESSGIAFAQLHLQSHDPGQRSGSRPLPGDGAGDIKVRQMEASEDIFAVDLVGTKPTFSTGLPPPVARHRSLSPSSSDEDVLVFKGRNRLRRNVATHNPSSPLQPRTRPATVRTLDDSVAATTSAGSNTNGTLRETSGVNDKPSWDDTKVKWSHGSGRRDPDKVRGAGKVPKGWGAGKDRGTARRKHEEEAFADYVDNMRQNEVLEDDYSSANAPRVLAHEAAIGLADDDETSSRSRRKTRPSHAKDGWSSGDLDDFDDLSTTQGILGEVDCIIKKRHRKSGIQYLVVFEGCSTDEARWTLSTSLTSDVALEAIKTYEEEDALLMQIAAEEDWSDEPSDDDEDSDEDDSDPEEAFRDEEDFIRRRIERMSDEKIARLLAKQEELGMGSDELVLFDDGEMSTEDEDEVDVNIKISPGRRKTRVGGKRPRGEFPAASLLADVLEQDAYNGFDVMDWERPSLKRKSKGRKASLPFELSDSDLETSLQNAWAADRKKKREKKQEREELRAQGLLGKKNRLKPNTKARYRDGMSMANVRDELKGFLQSTYESHALPPMDKRDRKLIHEFASAFSLKSKSVGKGKSRFPVLYKTARTADYDEEIFRGIEARLERRFLPRMDAKRGVGGMKKRAGGGFGVAAVSYRDGEVVGAEAPELGAENKGRAMLEKMGWSLGTALGAVNNKGILRPIEHVVKTSKYGLG